MSESASLTVTGMKCGGCEAIVTNKLLSLAGVKSAVASSKDKSVNVEYDAGQTNLKAIAQAIVESGYAVVDGN